MEDIATAVERMVDHPEFGAARTMAFLAGDVERLIDAGLPPEAGPDYMARLSTLEEFYLRAADELQ